MALSIGSFERALTEARTATCTSPARSREAEEFKVEKEVVTALAQIGLENYTFVINELSRSSNPQLTSLRTFAQTHEAIRQHRGTSVSGGVRSATPNDSDDKDDADTEIADLVRELVEDAREVNSDATYKAIYAIAALIQSNGSLEEALVMGHMWLQKLPAPRTARDEQYKLELHALMIEALLKMNCVDEASLESHAMLAINDSAVLSLMYDGITQLYRAQLNPDSDNFERALGRFNEVAMQSGQSPRLLNLIALAQMGMRNYQAAEHSLLDALALQQNDTCSLANMTVISAQLGKSKESVQSYAQRAVQNHAAWSTQYGEVMRDIEQAIREFRCD